jgi:hypothetical protein
VSKKPWLGELSAGERADALHWVWRGEQTAGVAIADAIRDAEDRAVARVSTFSPGDKRSHAAEIDEALKRCERLQEALKPFAHEAWRHAPDDQPIAFTLGACRRARKALEQP